MVVTSEGIVTVVRPSQLKKAALLMVVTLAGMLIDVMPVQEKKAWSPMISTPSGMVVSLHPITNFFDVVSITALQPSGEL